MILLQMKKIKILATMVVVSVLWLTGCSTTALYAINQTVPSDTYRKTSDVYFDATTNLALDIYQPTSNYNGTNKNRPVLVFFYGGAWESGSKDEYTFVGEAFAAKGYVVVIPDYRKWPQVVSPAFMKDAAKATAWVQNNIASYGGNPTNIFLSGHSAGAHLASMITVDEKYLSNVGVGRANIRGFIGLAGPYDFDPGYDEKSKQFFGPPSNYPNVIPINFVDGSEPPMLLLQGGSDEVVWPDNANNMSNRIVAKGGNVRVKIYPDIGHSRIIVAISDTLRNIAPVVADMDAFIQAHSR